MITKIKKRNIAERQYTRLFTEADAIDYKFYLTHRPASGEYVSVFYPVTGQHFYFPALSALIG